MTTSQSPLKAIGSYMDELLDKAPCGFLVFDDEGVITNANSTLCTMLGFSAAELCGKKFESLLSIAGRIFYQTHLFPLIRLHHKAEEIFLTFISKEKSEIPVLLNAERKVGDEVAENHCVLLPVYQRKKFEAELIQARRTAEDALHKNEQMQQASEELELSRKALDRQVTRLAMINQDLARFSKVISHDMQEPVRKIAVFADIIQREQDLLSASGRKSLDRIKAAGIRMHNLIGSLLQFVSVDTEAGPVTSCNIEDLISAARQKVWTAFPDENVIIDISRLPVIEGNCEQLSLLFYHLIANAIQFRKEGAANTEIHIEATTIQHNSYRALQNKYSYTDFARIVFTDHGKGFSPEYAEYIFELFKKAHDEASGLGFGLALCKKIVENHWGYITAKSSPGEGTTFVILLPLKHQEGSVETPARRGS